MFKKAYGAASTDVEFYFNWVPGRINMVLGSAKPGLFPGSDVEIIYQQKYL